MIFVQQDQIIFLPSSSITKTPQNFNLKYQNITIPIENSPTGENLSAWWIPAELKSPKADKIILLFHGTDGNISDILSDAVFYEKLGFSIFVVDYRGFGNSKGNFPNEKQIYQDGQISYDYLTKIKKINPHNIIVFGHSLGTAVAIDLASHNPEISGVILQSSFTSMPEVLNNHRRFKLFPMGLIMTEKFNSLDKINTLKMPLLFIHGQSDGVVPYSMSERLLKKAISPQKKLVLIPNADHSDVIETNPQKYQQEIESFYSQLTQIKTN